jgi:hypothetical protein
MADRTYQRHRDQIIVISYCGGTLAAAAGDDSEFLTNMYSIYKEAAQVSKCVGSDLAQHTNAQ